CAPAAVPGPHRAGDAPRGSRRARGAGLVAAASSRDLRPFLLNGSEVPVGTRYAGVPAKSTSFASTVPAVRPGAVWYFQYRFVCAMTWSAGGAPHVVWSSVVWASLTSVVS